MRTERQSAGCLCPKHVEALGKIAAQQEEIIRLKARTSHLEARILPALPQGVLRHGAGSPAPFRGDEPSNRAERGVRGLVIARKTSFGGQSEDALWVREVNQSFMETLALRYADPAGKLAKALDIYAETGKKSDVREFLFPKR